LIADVTGAQPGKQRTSRAAARSTDWRRLNRPAGRPANTPLQKSRRLQIRANEKCQLSMRSGPDEAGKDEIRLRHTKYSGSDDLLYLVIPAAGTLILSLLGQRLYRP